MRLQICFCIIILIAEFEIGSAFVPLFDARIDYPVGSVAGSVFCADFNGDGYNDIVEAPYSDDSIAVLLNTRQGSFQPPEKYFAGDSVRLVGSTIFGSDLDNDGDKDISLICFNANKVCVLFNNGDGVFQLNQCYITGQGPTSIFASDLNGDSFPDLVITNYEENQVSIMLNDSTGNYNETFIIPCDGAYSAYAADLDNDGDNDLAIVTNNGISDTVSLMILLNNSLGAFQIFASYSDGSWAHDISVADVDEDGDDDIAIASGGHISLFLNIGDATFELPSRYQANDELYSIYIDDLNGDGHQDIAAVSYFSKLFLYLNSGDGTFADAVIYDPAKQSCSVFISDLDNDGLNDIIVASYVAKCVSVWHNNGDSFFPSPRNYSYPRNPWVIKAANFDGNANGDMIVATTDDTVLVMLGRGDETFQTSSRFMRDFEYTGIKISDFNADHIDDVIFTTIAPYNRDSCTVSLYINDGDGSFGPERRYYFQQTGYIHVFTDDFNSDGYADLVTSGFDSFSVFINNQNGSFNTPEHYYYHGHNIHELAAIDYDNDGDKDLSIGSYDTLNIFTNNGNGLFEFDELYSTPINILNIFALDFTGDGYDDLVLFEQSKYYSLRNTTNGIFEGMGITNFGGIGYGNSMPVMADIDGNGLKDIITAPTECYNITTIINLGNGPLEASLGYGMGGYVRGFDILDINADGKLDLVAAEQDRSIFKMQSLLNQSNYLGFPNGNYLTTSVYGLNTNYPNPFNPTTTIEYNLSSAFDVTLDIYDLLGRKIETLINTKQEAGHHSAIWDGRDRSSGIYFYKLRAGEYTETKKMLLLK
ncbi:MAG TPA: hypothetical protein DEO84_11235 [candidate division Zixibacteria bacterium]|nr:hypothetical protein [candidate division Zixibacteria bacterium]HBZ01881.1 hypothetical protein [candidate division Zixibacteria bacterium]